MNDARVEEQASREKLIADGDDAKRQLEECRAALRDAQSRLTELRNGVADRDRTVEALTVRCERLSHGLTAHKTQLVQCDNRLVTLSQRELELSNALR